MLSFRFWWRNHARTVVPILLAFSHEQLLTNSHRDTQHTAVVAAARAALLLSSLLSGAHLCLCLCPCPVLPIISPTECVNAYGAFVPDVVNITGGRWPAARKPSFTVHPDVFNCTDDPFSTGCTCNQCEWQLPCKLHAQVTPACTIITTI